MLSFVTIQKLGELETIGDLENKQSLAAIFNWFQNIAKMDKSIHVFLVSSEQFFYHWVDKILRNVCEVQTIGNLSKGNAEKYYNFLKFKNNYFVLISFIDIYKVIGME